MASKKSTKRYGLVVEEKDFTISCDQHQWILTHKWSRYPTYHGYLDELLLELLELNTKKRALGDKEKTIEAWARSYRQAEKEVLEIKNRLYGTLEENSTEQAPIEGALKRM